MLHNLGHATVGHIFIKSTLLCTIVYRHKLSKTKRIYSYFITSSTEGRYHILRQKTCITACHIYIRIFNFEITVKHIFKLRDMLYLINHNVIHTIVNHSSVNVFKQTIRIAKIFVSSVFQIYLYYMRIFNSLLSKPVCKQYKQKI